MQLHQVTYNRRGSSLIEIMAMIAILGLALTAVFATVVSGMRFASDSENRIKAINLAREGIEGMTNLRNTNWFRFSSDRTNCWRSKDYTSSCIGKSDPSMKLWEWTYIIKNTNGAWYLESGMGTSSWLLIDSNGFYYATWALSGVACNASRTTDCISPFTRTITLSNVTDSWVTVQSRVDWNQHGPQKVILETSLTNWKSKF